MDPGFASFLLAAILMELTPGPNMTWLALLAAREGRGAGLRAVAGILLGLAILAIAAAAGVTALLTTYPALAHALRWAGVAFLLYLAVEAWIGEKADPEAIDKNRPFRRGLIVNLLNPKAATVFVVLIPKFAGDVAAPHIAIFDAVYLVIATLAHILIVLFASTFQKALAQPRLEELVRRIFSIALAGVAVWFAFTS